MISYNSCRNRHCPKCQASKHAIWVVDRLINDTLPVKHFHIVFTVPHVLNDICLIDSAAFYNRIFACAWGKPWVVYCQPSMAGADLGIRYLGNYTIRVAITNIRILKVTDNHVTSSHKDYAQNARVTPITRDGVEFLRRFCLHILPKKFVKIRRFGVYSARYKAVTRTLKPKTIDTIWRENETYLQMLIRVTRFDFTLCPVCKIGRLIKMTELPKIRSPTNFYAQTINFC
jgi:hypothetical protein